MQAKSACILAGMDKLRLNGDGDLLLDELDFFFSLTDGLSAV